MSRVIPENSVQTGRNEWQSKRNRGKTTGENGRDDDLPYEFVNDVVLSIKNPDNILGNYYYYYYYYYY